MKKILLIITFVFIRTTGSANPFSQLSGYSGKTSDQIKIHHSEVIYDNNKKDLFWPYQEESESPFSSGVKLSTYEVDGPILNFNSYALRALASYKIKPQQLLLANLGGQQIKQSSFGDGSFFVGGLKYQNQWTESLSSDISFDRQLLFPLIVPLNNDPRKLYTSVLQSVISWRLYDSYDLQLKNRFNFIEDNNQSSDTDLQMMYALSRFPHWIRVGFGGQYFAYQNRSNSYWSPQQFSTWGPRLDMSYSLYKQLQYFFGGSYNFFKENDSTSGNGFYMRTGLQYGDRNVATASLAYEKTKSIQSGRAWTSDALNLNVTVFW